MMFSNGANRDPSFLPRLYKALANFPVACAPYKIAFLAPIVMVVIMPATDIAIADRPTRFSLAHSLKHCNLDMSSSCCSLTSSLSACLRVISLASLRAITLSSNSMSPQGCQSCLFLAMFRLKRLESNLFEL